MKRKYTFIVLLLTFYLLNSVEVLAIRAFSPAKISPIIYKDIKIVAQNSSPENMGIVQAFDEYTNKLIWSKQVYEVKMNPRIEADAQWVFIEDMRIDGDKLVVTNERQKMFTLDPNTGEDLDKSNSVTIRYIAIPIIVIILMVIVNFMKKSRT